MAEIILFRPVENQRSKLSSRCPLGLVYLATYLKDRGYLVKLIDATVTQDWRKELKNSLDSSTICAGVSVMTGYQIQGALDFAKLAHEIKGLPVVWGGLHPTLTASQTIQHECVDAIILSEGEKHFHQYIEALKHKSGMEAVGNLIYKDNGSVINTAKNNDAVDMNALSLPDFSFIDFEYYSKQSFASGLQRKKRVAWLNVDRGCPCRCAFCYNIKFNERKYRAMDAGKVLDQISLLINKYNIDGICFVSDNFFVNQNRVHTICKGIVEEKYNLGWQADMRIDTFLRYDDEVIKLMKKSGCDSLTFGIETGSDKMLRLIQKDITVDQVIEAHNRAKKFGFYTNYHFMIGFPRETTKDINETMRLMWYLRKDKNVTFYGPSTYVPYPGTPLYEDSVSLGFKPPENLNKWIAYDWDEYSKLPWFTKSFKNYLLEVQHIAGHSYFGIGRSVFFKIYAFYCKMRLFGLLHRIRFFNIDRNIVILLLRIYKKLKHRSLLKK